MRYGVVYYPEHRSLEEFEKDVSLMAEAGFNVVRMGEFAWCKFEPEEGKYNFSWLDHAIEKLGNAGISSILCTPTAAPPVWLFENHPEVQYKDNRGVVKPFGGRRNYCYNNKIYREYSRKIAEKIALHYKDNPNVIAFNIDNEFAQESSGRCQCDVCKDKFTNWLSQKYENIDQLNTLWGTIFWGQHYSRFDQIHFPLKTIELGTAELLEFYADNPSLRLEFERFCSDSILEYQNIQEKAIRNCCDKVVTTNSTSFCTNSVNYYKAFKTLDKYTFDIYPDLRGHDMYDSAFNYSFARGIKNSRFWIAEMACGGGHCLWPGQGILQSYPGAIKQEVLHAFASGAELITHFQFSTFPFGAEQLDPAVLGLDGIPGRRYYELKEAAQDLKKLESILLNSEIKNDAAICIDYDSLWALKIKPVNKNFNYLNYCGQIHSILLQKGIGADVIPCDKSIEQYKFIIIPALFVMTEEFKDTLKEYVRSGGIVLSTFLTAVKDIYNVGIKDSLPCGLTDLFRVRVTEVEPVFEASGAEIILSVDGKELRGRNHYWTESLDSLGAKIIGTYGDTFRKGEGVLSSNTYGKGKAYYLAAGLDDKLFAQLANGIITEASAIPNSPFKLEYGMEMLVRYKDEKPIYFIFNFTQKETKVLLDKSYTDILSGKVLEKNVSIGPKGYIVLELI